MECLCPVECQLEMEMESSPAPGEVTLFSAYPEDRVEISLGGEQDWEVLCASQTSKSLLFFFFLA